MNIHDIVKDDEVSGQIIGDFLVVGQLTYCGKNQRSKIYAISYDELFTKAEVIKNEIRQEIGSVFNDIYPLDEWRLIILQ